MARALGAAAVLSIVPVDGVLRERLPSDWSNFALVLFRVLIAVGLVLAVPVMWHAGSLLLMAIVAASMFAEPVRRVLVISALSIAGLSATALVHGIAFWWLSTSSIAVGTLVLLVCFEEVQSERSEVDRRHDELVDRAAMFSWEIDARSGRILSMAGNVRAVLGWDPDELIGKHVATIVDVPKAQQVMEDEEGLRDDVERPCDGRAGPPARARGRRRRRRDHRTARRPASARLYDGPGIPVVARRASR